MCFKVQMYPFINKLKSIKQARPGPDLSPASEQQLTDVMVIEIPKINHTESHSGVSCDIKHLLLILICFILLFIMNNFDPN